MRARRPARPLAALAATVALVLTSAACSSSSDDGSGPTTTVKTEIGDSASVSSTTAGAVTTTTTVEIPSSPTGLDTPKAAAERLYTSWKANDRPGALTVAEPVAVDAIFTAAPGDYKLYSGCDTGEFAESGCLYRGDTGTIQLNMEKRNDLWVVISAFYSA